jgi:hypothetical protein
MLTDECELDGGAFERLLDTIDLEGPLWHECAVPNQFR